MEIMLHDEAMEIIKNPGLHKSEKVLAAVKQIKKDLAEYETLYPEDGEQLDSFYNTYFDYRKEYEKDVVNDYDVVAEIFAGSKYEQNYREMAEEFVSDIKDISDEDLQGMSFAELDRLQSVVRAYSVTNSSFVDGLLMARDATKIGDYMQLHAKLEEAVRYKLEQIDANTTMNDKEAEAVEHFVANVVDYNAKKTLNDLVKAKVVSDYDEENGLAPVKNNDSQLDTNTNDVPADDTPVVAEINSSDKVSENDTDVNTDTDVADVNDDTSSYEEELLKIDDSADDLLNDISLYDEDGDINSSFYELEDTIKNISIVDDDGNEIEDKSKYIEILFEAAKVDAHKAAFGKQDYDDMFSYEKKDYLVKEIKDAFLMKVGQAAVASTIDRPSEEELANEETFAQYIQKRDAKAQEVVEDIVNNKAPVKLKDSQAEMAVADTELEAEKFNSRLERKVNNQPTRFAARLDQLKSGAKNLWGQRHEIKKVVVKSVKDNKWQHIANLSATGVMWGGILLGGPVVAGAAIGAYGAYTAAGSYLWPLRAERQKLQAEAKTQGKKMGYWEAIKQAYQNKKDDKAYKLRRRAGLIGGVASIGLGGFGVSAWGVKSARLLAAAARGVAGNTVQFATVLGAKKEYKLNPTDENKTKLNMARGFLGLSAASTAALTLFTMKSFDANTNALSDVAANSGSNGAEQPTTTTTPVDTSVSDTTATADTTNTAVEEVVPAEEDFGGPKIAVDVDSFSADEKAMFINSKRLLGSNVLDAYYDAFRNGMVESLPEGMSPAQYVDALVRLQMFSAHPEAVKLMYQELNCDDFHPTDEQKQAIADALKDISYEHGKMKVAIADECGNLHVKEVSRFGQYIGKQRVVEAVVDGHKETMPLRNANRALSVGATVDCADGKVTLHGRVKLAKIPCDEPVIKSVEPKQVVIPQEPFTEIDCPDINDANMPENTSGYQTSGQYTSPIKVNVNRNTGHYLVDGNSVASNELMQRARGEFASAGMNDESKLSKLPGVIRETKDKVVIYLNEGSITPAKGGDAVDCASGQPVEFEMKRDDYLSYLKNGEMPSTTKSVPLSEENYNNILMDEQFAYSGDKAGRSNFTTSVAGAEYFSMPAPVDFTGAVDQLAVEGKVASVTMGTSSGDVDVFVNTETGEITAKMGDKPVRFSPETQEAAAKALTESLSARYDVNGVSLEAPEGTLAKKAEMAIQGQPYVPAHDQVAQNIHATGKVNFGLMAKSGGRA